MGKKNRSTNVVERKDLVIEVYPEKAVTKEMGGPSVEDRDAFIASLGLIAKSLQPRLKLKKLETIDKSVFQLRADGTEAWRCIYTTEVPGKIVVLHVCQKTTEGVDTQLKNVVELRLKALREHLKAERQAEKKKRK